MVGMLRKADILMGSREEQEKFDRADGMNKEKFIKLDISSPIKLLDWLSLLALVLVILLFGINARRLNSTLIFIVVSLILMICNTILVLKMMNATVIYMEDIIVDYKSYIRFTEVSRKDKVKFIFCISQEDEVALEVKGMTVYISANTEVFSGDSNNQYKVTFGSEQSAQKFYYRILDWCSDDDEYEDDEYEDDEYEDDEDEDEDSRYENDDSRYENDDSRYERYERYEDEDERGWRGWH